MYDIKHLVDLETALQANVREHFEAFFSTHSYEHEAKNVSLKSIHDLASVDSTYSGTGLYVILTDYQMAGNSCSLVVDGLKAIYRGHCFTVKKRLSSHLFNEFYRANLPERGVRYDVCMKLDDNNGINIDSKPYSDYRWSVLVHKMKGSSKMMREQAELAFDNVFGRPIGSREGGDKKRKHPA